VYIQADVPTYSIMYQTKEPVYNINKGNMLLNHAVQRDIIM